MAQKPYKYNIEYIQKFYSHGTEAKVLELKPVYKKAEKPKVPKQSKEPVTTVCIDPVAFCSLMVAVVMLVVMLVGVIQFVVVGQDYAVMENYLHQLQQENIALNQRYTLGYDLEDVATTARALGMIPVEEAQTLTVEVVVPTRTPEPTFLDNVKWFLAGLFA